MEIGRNRGALVMGEDKTGKKQRYDGKGHSKKEEKNAVQKKKAR